MTCQKLFISMFLRIFYRTSSALSTWFACPTMTAGTWWRGTLTARCMCGGTGATRSPTSSSTATTYDHCLHCLLSLKYFLYFYLNDITITMFNVLDWKFFNTVTFILMFLTVLAWAISNTVTCILIINRFTLSILFKT